MAGLGTLPAWSENKQMLAFYSDETGVSLPAGSRFPAERFRLLREAVARDLPGVRLQSARAATPAALCAAHDAGYVDAVLHGHLSAAEQREIGFAQTAQTVLRARRSVGATLQAMQAALREGVAANLAGGSHHARAQGGAGYCVFNDVAVAARWFQRAGGGRPRVAVIDLDVHQGNGTAAIFQGDASVFTLSIHGERNYPFRKEASCLDVELPDGCGDADYLAALDDALAELWRRTADEPPLLVFYLAGADPHEGDRLGRLRLSAEGLAERDRRVFAAASERRIPLVLTMAGGYGSDLEGMVRLQLETVGLALAHWRRIQPGWNELPGMYARVSLDGAIEGEPG
jgi:acetoin utilization deacetylase AcuC-like enzyme